MTYFPVRNVPGLEPLPLPITAGAIALAQQFAREQPTPQKADQVYQNTLAICLVRDYLTLMGIPTDLAASYSWNPVTRLCADTADLMIPDVGRLECRAVSGAESNCAMPPEVWADRVGYVVVAVDEASQQGQILGFAAAVIAEVLTLEQLQPIEAALDVLDPIPVPDFVTAVVGDLGQAAVQLGRWFQNEFDQAWQTIESLSLPVAYAVRYRTEAVGDPAMRVRRGKVMTLGTATVALVVEVQPQDNQAALIDFRIYPGAGALPVGLTFAIVDAMGTVFAEAIATGREDYLQLSAQAEAAESFAVRLQLDDIRVTAAFVN
jgi:Protein of unknown function (DUF1822)